MTDKTIPEICADLMLKRDICASPLGSTLRWADYSNDCAEAVPLLVEEIRRLQALLESAPQAQKWQPIVPVWQIRPKHRRQSK